MKWKIGNIEIKNQLVLAPMAGISNTSYRKIIKGMGAGLIYAEMVSTNAIAYGNEKTFNLLKMSEEERPIVQQIFGSDIKTFVAAAKLIEEKMHPDIIDINMGCPVPKVAVRAQAGSALLKNPEKIGEIVKAVVKSVTVPVTVKIRSGWDEKNINAVEVAKICEKNGASAIAIHARTRSEGYSGKANWDIIKKVKESVNIPVIGNGDITSPILAKKMLDETGCDAIMIGRGALGNPWIFKQCLKYLENNAIIEEPTNKEKIEMIKEHYRLLKEDKNEHIALLEIRTHALYYLKGMPESKIYKECICKSKNEEEFLNILKEYENYLNNKK
ncbi:MAG: tRNA dihydrouridine synthase DusB [Bacilli bacterium]|jgi:tRNA-dihydrouridine synthase B|nr:tRNA dihydrouridine synthase DusB [Bacilli bacterium]